MIIKDGLGLTSKAWRIPALGHASDEDLPDWLLVAILQGWITFNRLGGLSTPSSDGLPGDLMVLDRMGGVVVVDRTVGKALEIDV